MPNHSRTHPRTDLAELLRQFERFDHLALQSHRTEAEDDELGDLRISIHGWISQLAGKGSLAHHRAIIAWLQHKRPQKHD